MTTIKTTCQNCGDIRITPEDVFLELEPGGREGVYIFTCPECGLEQRREANHRVVSVLLATGVRFEIIEPEVPLCEDEVDEFTVYLDSVPDSDIWTDLLSSEQE